MEERSPARPYSRHAFYLVRERSSIESRSGKKPGLLAGKSEIKTEIVRHRAMRSALCGDIENARFRMKMLFAR
jgi:hypothetical protein